MKEKGLDVVDLFRDNRERRKTVGEHTFSKKPSTENISSNQGFPAKMIKQAIGNEFQIDCEKCSFTVSTKDQLLKHYSSKHLVAELKKKFPIYYNNSECTFCGETVLNEKEKSVHIGYTHGKAEELISSSDFIKHSVILANHRLSKQSPEDVQNINTNKEENLELKKANTNMDMEMSKKEKSSVKLFADFLISKQTGKSRLKHTKKRENISKSEAKFRVRRLANEPRNFKCSICPKGYTNNGHLNDHYAGFHYKNELCDKYKNDKATLACIFCGKVSSNKVKYAMHVGCVHKKLTDYGIVFASKKDCSKVASSFFTGVSTKNCFVSVENVLTNK